MIMYCHYLPFNNFLYHSWLVCGSIFLSLLCWGVGIENHFLSWNYIWLCAVCVIWDRRQAIYDQMGQVDNLKLYCVDDNSMCQPPVHSKRRLFVLSWTLFTSNMVGVNRLVINNWNITPFMGIAGQSSILFQCPNGLAFSWREYISKKSWTLN